ncbi:MAG: hypothetical protein MK008_07105 [Bdellovibrionales bacterium]|nr:hypothetical protein [Bdellovibrionales bacterium]
MKKSEQKDSKFLIILMLCFVFAGLYMLFGVKNTNMGQVSQSSVQPKKQEGSVNWERLNEKMRMLEGQKKIQQMQQEARNAQLSRELEFSDIRDRAKPAHEYHLDMLPENSSNDVYSDLDHHQYIPDSQKPRDIINAQKELDQILNNLDKQRKKEFVKQFIENARNGGWQVKVSDELKVIEVRPIRQRRGFPGRAPQSSPKTSETGGYGVN